MNKRLVPNVAPALGVLYAGPTGQGLVGEPQEKWRDIFRSNHTNRRRVVLTNIFTPFPNSILNWNLLKRSKAMNRFVKIKLEWQISVRPVRSIKVDYLQSWSKNSGRNGLFRLTFNRNFRNFWHNGKHPWSILLLSPLEAIRLRWSLYYWKTTVHKNFFCFLYCMSFSVKSVAWGDPPPSSFQLSQVFRSRFAIGFTQKLLRHLAS